MRVFVVSGYSGRGKTSLVEEIVRALVGSGYSVATIKSSKHEAGPEHGTDTWRHKQAGASMTILLSRNSIQGGLRDRINPEDLKRLSHYDFLIVEGMKSVNIPKFWCVGDARTELKEVPINTQAIVSWSDSEIEYIQSIPVISSKNINGLIEIVKSHAVDISTID